MKKKIALVSILGILAALLAIVPLSCDGDGGEESSSSGDGGGGGGGTTPTQPAEQAALNEENVDYSLQFIVDNVSGCSFGAAATARQNKWRTIVDLSLELNDRITSASISRQSHIEATETETEEIEGGCGGDITVSITSDDVTGEVSGSISFNDFCEDVDESQFNIGGYLEFSGKIDTETDELTELSGSTGIDGITLQQEEDSYTFGFQSVVITIEEDSISATADSIFLREVSDGEVKEYRVENIAFEGSEGDTTTTITASGQFIHPDEGAISFSTLQPIIVSDEEVILSGQVEIEGSDGTSAVLTVTDDNVFQIQADTDGDGEYDYFPDNLDCSEFDLDLDL
jgi:hypothetical protein